MPQSCVSARDPQPTGVTTIGLFVLLCAVGKCSSPQSVGHLTSEGVPLIRGTLVLQSTIGESSTDRIGRPQQVSTDSEGNVYVVDAVRQSVMVYSPDGLLQTRFGQRGEDLGSFLNIACIGIANRDKLVVVDSALRRIALFSSNGQLISSRALPKVDSVLTCYVNGNLLFAVTDSRQHDLVRVYDLVSLEVVDSFGRPSEFRSYQTFGSLQLATLKPGSLAVAPRNRVFFTPFVYSGEIHTYEYHEMHRQSNRLRRWRRGRSNIQGYILQVPSVEVFDSNNAPLNITPTFSGTTRGRRYYGIIHNESRGLFVLSTKELAHFVVLRVNDYRVLGVELFGRDGKLIGFLPLHAVPVEKEDRTNLGLLPLWKDRNDIFYIVDNREYPVIRLCKLEIHGALPETSLRTSDAASLRVAF
jgi:hypothetical protein